MHLAAEPLTDREAEKLLDMYNVTDVGIGWTWGSVLNCTDMDLDETRFMDQRDMMLKLQCGTLQLKQLKELDPLQEHLKICTIEPFCEAVSLRLEIDDEGESFNARYSVCRFSSPLVAFLNESELENDDCLCLKRCVPKVLEKMMFCTSCNSLGTYLILEDFSDKMTGLADRTDAEVDMGAFFCRVIVSFAWSVLCVLNFVACVMSIVVYRFLQNHCGDDFIEEDQFCASMSFHARDSEIIDDFDEAELERRRGSCDARQGRGSTASEGSVELAKMER